MVKFKTVEGTPMKLKILVILLFVVMTISGIALAWAGTHGDAGRMSGSFDTFTENLMTPSGRGTSSK